MTCSIMIVVMIMLEFQEGPTLPGMLLIAIENSKFLKIRGLVDIVCTI